ncbi:hypothetical protein GF312_02390 [Candidatus Poribacteria bacterium]|nr:hypothetical protein [Candidatus Poribacteria bacterium]
MLWFRRKKKKKKKDLEDQKEQVEQEKEEKSSSAQNGSGEKLLKNVESGLNSQWFVTKKFEILKELEGAGQAKGLIEDKGKERAITSTMGSLKSAIEAFESSNDKEGLKQTADLALLAYSRIGNSEILDIYDEVCEKAEITEAQKKEKLIEMGDKSSQVDIEVNLYSKAEAKDKLIETGNKAMNLYLEASELDMKSRSRLFDYIVKAYKNAGDREALIQAGDQALKNQIDTSRLSHEEDWVLDAQKAYEAADDKDKLSRLGNQYVNLYLQERIEVWLDKAIPVYEKAGINAAEKMNNLADKLEEKGHSSMADTMRRKAEL